MVLETIRTLCVLVFVLVLMIFTLKGLSKYQNKITGNKNIKVLERTSLSQNTTLNIVKIGDKMYLISATSKEVKILKELENEDINENLYKSMKIEDIKLNSIFKSTEEYFSKVKGKGKDEKKSS